MSDTFCFSKSDGPDQLILFHIVQLTYDTQQINFFGRQLNNAHFLEESFEIATNEPFCHLLIDLDPKTSDVLLYCSNIVPPEPSFF